MTKYPQKGVVRVQWPKIEYEYHFHKSGTGEARNVKFSVQIDLGKSHLMSDKIPHKGPSQGQGDIFLNFKPPSVNLE